MKKTVIITGGSKGIGLGLVKEYSKNGYRVISISRTKNPKQIDVEQYQCDISNIENIENVMIEIFSELENKVDKITLINNAGYLGDINSIEEIEPSNINYTISINLIAPIVFCSQFIKFTKKIACKKQIINISSGAAVSPYESWSMYCSSKAGLDMLTKVVSKEQSNVENNVDIVSIYPGVVETNMQETIRKTPENKFRFKSKFVDLFENGELYTTKYVAVKIFELDNLGQLENGNIIDLRSLEK